VSAIGRRVAAFVPPEPECGGCDRVALAGRNAGTRPRVADRNVCPTAVVQMRAHPFSDRWILLARRTRAIVVGLLYRAA